MKKTLLSIALFSTIYLSAQTTIVEDKDAKTYRYTKATLLPNSNFIINGRDLYDENGTAKPFMDPSIKFGFIKSANTENAFAYQDDSEGVFKIKMGYIIDSKLVELKNAELRDDNILVFEKSQNFTSKYIYTLRNSKGKFDVDFEKDDLYLCVKDMLTRKKNTFKIEKPNLDRYIGSNFIKSKEEFRFNLAVNYDNTVDLISKSISKDYSNTLLYRTSLSNEGKKINELVYDLKIPNHVFLYSNNGGGKFVQGGYDNKFKHFGDDLSINNYIEDFKTGDIYVYGLYGNDSAKLNDMASPKGFYVFKFDKEGNKLWESINDIKDADLNKNHVMTTVFVDLYQLGNNVCFTIRINGLKDFFNYSIIDKPSGKVAKTQNLKFDETFAHLDDTDNNHYDINSDFKGISKAKFDFNGIVAVNSNSKVADYVKNVKSRNNLFFSSQFSDKGIWLYEACENEYFKVTLFKN